MKFNNNSPTEKNMRCMIRKFLDWPQDDTPAELFQKCRYSRISNYLLL